mgnify:CR=1 FL=1
MSLNRWVSILAIRVVVFVALVAVVACSYSMSIVSLPCVFRFTSTTSASMNLKVAVVVVSPALKFYHVSQIV